MTRDSIAPFPWYGGKQYIASVIAEMLPPHASYVEVFGGAASLLFAKTPAKLEVYNDVDQGLVNFFRVLRDAGRCAELQAQLSLTPYARAEWQECRVGWRHADTDVEMARRWFVAVVGSFGKHLGSGTGWSYSRTPGHDSAHSFRTTADRLGEFVQRLRHVQVESADFADVMRRFDSVNTVHYCDPPYLPETRGRADRYRHEMTASDHERFLADVGNLKGMVVVSGYRSRLYDHELSRAAGWRRVDISVNTAVAKGTRLPRTECLWFNRACQRAQPSLWASEVGA